MQPGEGQTHKKDTEDFHHSMPYEKEITTAYSVMAAFISSAIISGNSDIHNLFQFIDSDFDFLLSSHLQPPIPHQYKLRDEIYSRETELRDLFYVETPHNNP